MNGLFSLLGIEAWKPVLTALLLPPVPLLLLTLAGARMILWRRGVGWAVLLLSVVGLWLMSTAGAGDALQRALLQPPAALGADRIAELRRDGGRGAIVVLGGGRESHAPEYGMSNLNAHSMERLRYGLWLGRQTGLPVAFSGGVGHGQHGATPEGEIAARIAAQEFGRPLRWVEAESRDTRENAQRTVPLLEDAGVSTLVVVTHAYHATRSLREFERAAARSAPAMRIVMAPVALAPRVDRPALRWLPSGDGAQHVRQVLRDAVALWLS